MYSIWYVCNKNVFFGIFGRVVQLLWKWNVVRRTFLLTSMLDRHTYRTMKGEEVHCYPCDSCPPLASPFPLYREKKRAREGESVAGGWGEEGESDPKKTTAKKRGLQLQFNTLRTCIL
jgi:hypothetical protein